jgi:hypothetical protein
VASKPRTWRCQRVKNGDKCSTDNPRIKQKCTKCGGPRPKSRPPSHRRALDLPFDAFLLANDGVRACAICGSTKNLQRDHEHRDDGLVRGILCWRHNKLLSDNDWTPEMLRAAADYLERADRRRGINLEALL